MCVTISNQVLSILHLLTL